MLNRNKYISFVCFHNFILHNIAACFAVAESNSYMPVLSDFFMLSIFIYVRFKSVINNNASFR